MAIVVPSLPPISSFPPIDRGSVPFNEHEALAHLEFLLASLAGLEQRFWTAVLLVESSYHEMGELASGEPRVLLDPAGITLRGWTVMAARDGALTIYHFGKTIDALRQSFNSCPYIKGLVDHQVLREASKSFRREFPDSEAIRHVVGHVIDFCATPLQREHHSAQGPTPSGSDPALSNERQQFHGMLDLRTYIVSYAGCLYSYEICEKTARQLNAVKLKIYSSLQSVAVGPEAPGPTT
jgi:hypothetical protein